MSNSPSTPEHQLGHQANQPPPVVQQGAVQQAALQGFLGNVQMNLYAQFTDAATPTHPTRKMNAQFTEKTHELTQLATDGGAQTSLEAQFNACAPNE